MRKFILSTVALLVFTFPCLAQELTKADFNLSGPEQVDPRDRLLNKLLDKVDALERKINAMTSPIVTYPQQQETYYYPQAQYFWYYPQPQQYFTGGGGGC